MALLLPAALRTDTMISHGGPSQWREKHSLGKEAELKQPRPVRKLRRSDVLAGQVKRHMVSLLMAVVLSENIRLTQISCQTKQLHSCCDRMRL